MAASSDTFEPVRELPLAQWTGPVSAEIAASAVDAVEQGAVLLFPHLAFALLSDERRFLDPHWHDGKAKNISFDIATGKVRGTRAEGQDLVALGIMLRRFAESARGLCRALFPQYEPALRVMRTSYRALPVDREEPSWRKDDRRLHIDAFPSRPNHGARILRVFHNLNPHGEPRVWRIGEPFPLVAEQFFARLPAHRPAAARVLAALRVTKGVRSAYDHFMLHLHDAMKADATYQRDARQVVMPFSPGTTWVCFSDQVSHAAMGGQYMLEQTLHLPVSAMVHPERSPLRTLERLAGGPLAPTAA